MATLSPHETNVYTFTRRYLSKHGISPSLQEISAAVGLSPTMVKRYLDKLEAHGKIAREPGQARSIRIIGMSAQAGPTDAELWLTFRALVEQAHDLTSRDDKARMRALQVYSQALALYQRESNLRR